MGNFIDENVCTFISQTSRQFDIDVNNNATSENSYDVVPIKYPTGSQDGPTYGFNLGYSDNNQGYNLRPGNEKYFVSHIDIVY